MTYDQWKTRSPDDEADRVGHYLETPRRKNLRTLSMRADELELADHDDITAAMKRAGFKFDHATCPVKLRKPWTAVRDEKTGIVTWTQWDGDAA